VAREIGIDLGHTNSRTAWRGGAEGPQILPNSHAERVTPTVLAVHTDGQILVGSVAAAWAALNPGRGVTDLVARLGAGEPVLVNGSSFEPQKLAAYLLGRLKADAEERLNEPVSRAFVAVPPTWDEAARERLRAAGEQVQLAVTPVESSLAAALAAGYREPAPQRQFLVVYELGGATCSVTVLVREGAGLSVVRAATLEGVGGTAFDQQIVDYVTVLIQQQHQVDPAGNLRFMAELRKQAEHAKISLGARRVSDIVIMGGLRSAGGASIDVEVDLGREEFERMIEHKVAATVALTRQVVYEAGLAPEQIDAVITTGGSTLVPYVRAAVEVLFGPEKRVRGADPLEGVALGAAWLTGSLAVQVLPAGAMAVVAAEAAPAEAAPIPEAEAEQVGEDEIPTTPPVAEAPEVVEEPAPEAVEEPAPEAVEPAPEAVEEPAPEAVEEPAPEAVEEPAPEAVEEPAPEVVEPAPEVEEPVVAEAPALEVEELPPVEPVVEEAAPAEAEPAPVEGPPPPAPELRLVWEEVPVIQVRRRFVTAAFVRVGPAGVLHLATPAEAEGPCLSTCAFYLDSPTPENLEFTLLLRWDGRDVQAVMSVPAPPGLAPGDRIEVSLEVDYETGVPYLTLKWQEPEQAEPSTLICRDWVLREEEPVVVEAAPEPAEEAVVEAELVAAPPAEEAAPVPMVEEEAVETAAAPSAVVEVEEAPPPPEPPKELCGPYEVLEPVESARYYEVLLGRDPATDARVLVTVFTRDDERARSAFLSCLLPLGLDHPHVVRVCDFGQAAKGYWLATEYAGTRTLRDLLGTGAERQPAPIDRVLALAVQVCEGLEALQQRHIIHRNLKPSNVLIDAGWQTAKITDFQIAVSLRGRDQVTHVTGTLPYMAKEVLEGRADHRADIYSVGVMLYELLTGRLPFWATSQRVLVDQITHQQPAEPRSLNPRIPEYLNDAILRALEKDPARRHQTAAELREALTREPESWFHTITAEGPQP
jgi:hypothetical protein